MDKQSFLGLMSHDRNFDSVSRTDDQEKQCWLAGLRVTVDIQVLIMTVDRQHLMVVHNLRENRATIIESLGLLPQVVRLEPSVSRLDALLPLGIAGNGTSGGPST